ncbi:metallophosphoesterase family protein [Dactylosporangium sp. NPDC005572]|uniref:metallophosphoesterase family protein n=1 Tax=Dactylosporangium sp. NPDC005572 TaxID=3156889 RepID=UPI0033AD8789
MEGLRPAVLMLIAFVGDVHGRVLHAFAALLTLQRRRGVALDAVVQVGDLGAYPGPERMDAPSRRFLAEHPAEGDFFRLLDPDPALAAAVTEALKHLPPMHFVSGNHEDFEFLAAIGGGPVDPLGAVRHVPDGTVAELAGQRVAFLGRVEEPGYMDLDPDALGTLLAAPPGSADILVTHDGPHGLCTDWQGTTRGSPKLAALIDHLQPALHVSGHYHHPNGPRHYGRTVSYALSELVYPRRNRRRPEHDNPRQQVMAGAIGLYDTGTGAFELIDDDWLADVHGDHLDLATFLN